jgi:hypothetical protein
LIHFPPNGSERVKCVYLAPMIPVSLNFGYHATRRASLRSIWELGLLPSTPDRQTTTDRSDCEGNIYVCERLGTPADTDDRGRGSVHWWRTQFAESNRFNDPDWVILRVEVSGGQGARVYQDIWSNSGIIIDNVPRIPPDLIQLEYLPEP